MNAGGQLRIRALGTRIFHRVLATTIVAAWILDRGPKWVLELHRGLGYVALAPVCVRVCVRVWRGFAGPPNERFGTFLAGPRRTLDHAGRIATGREPRFLGHNPLGGWMIVALIVTILAVCISGWLFTTDRYRGYEWVIVLHATLADLLAALIIAHVAGVVFTSVRQGENPVGAMIHGRKPATTRRHPEEAADL